MINYILFEATQCRDDTRGTMPNENQKSKWRTYDYATTVAAARRGEETKAVVGGAGISVANCLE